MKPNPPHNRRTRHPLEWPLLLLSAGLAGWSANAADLSVTIGGLKSADGQVLVALFSAAGDFPARPWRRASTAAKPGAVTVTFKDLPAGTYAVSAFQDANGNQTLDKNVLGQPKEPYGFSRDARGLFGPPSFDATRFSVPSGAYALELQLQ